jgi:formamidopyrimidine-DNA glycosylase
MPELPELEVLRDDLLVRIKGKKIDTLRILKPYILKDFFKGDLVNETIEEITRRGKYLIVNTDSHHIAIHLMLHGSLQYSLPSSKTKKSSAALLVFRDGTVLEFNERGSKKRMSIYVTPKDVSLARIAKLGIEPLDKKFTVAKLQDLLKSDNKQLKSFLCSQSKVAGIGNAYADEILWYARLSPFKLTANLTGTEISRLHQAIRDVLRWAIAQVNASKRPGKRDFLNIHGKKDQVCPRCGENIQVVSFSRRDTYYCPKCQTGGKKLKDRRLSKLYR